MRIAIACCLVLFGMSCTNNNKPTAKSSTPTEENLPDAAPPAIDTTFAIGLEVKEVAPDVYQFYTALELDSGCYVVSPQSNDNVYGHFTISIDENAFLAVGDTVYEVPVSVAEFDPVLEAPVQFVRQDSKFIKELKLLTAADFTATGMISFVLEPICNPYEVAFEISQKNGTLSVQKTSTTLTFVR